MKNFLTVFFALFMSVHAAAASDMKQLPLKNIPDGKIICITKAESWSTKSIRECSSCYKKVGTAFYSTNWEGAFDTKCDYVFIHKGKLIGYNDKSLKFYEFSPNNETVEKVEYSPKELSALFRNSRIIKLSDFSPLSNSYKFKKTFLSENIIIYNDIDANLENYIFTTNNAKFKTYPINSMIQVTKSGMIQFAPENTYNKDVPWFIILVR